MAVIIPSSWQMRVRQIRAREWKIDRKTDRQTANCLLFSIYGASGSIESLIGELRVVVIRKNDTLTHKGRERERVKETEECKQRDKQTDKQI